MYGWGPVKVFKGRQSFIKTRIVMYLLAKLKPFEQKEHFSLKEQNGLGWNQAYVRKGPTCQGDRTHDLHVGSCALSPTGPPIPFYLNLWLADLYVRH